MTVTKEKFYIIKPKASINLCTNPSFETGTTGWTTGGTNTIATSAVQQRRGVYSCKCTYTDNDLLASYAITLTDADHVAAMDIYIPSTYTGTQLTLTWTGFTSGTVVAGLADMTIKDHWQRVHCHINPDAGDLAGTLTLSETGTNGDAAQFIYIDGVQIETGMAPTTYFDGNIIETIKKVNQYYWTGQANASTSVRLATTRSGGELIDITDYCKKIDVIGLGMAPTDVNSIPLVDGTKRYQRTNLTSRYFTLAVAFNDTTIGAVQADRNALIELVKPDLVPYDQPLVIRYQGETDAGLAASEPIDIKCVYVSGLDTGLQRDFERANIVFEIQDAYLKKDGNKAVSLDYNDTLADADYIVYRDRNGAYSTIGSGANGTVRAIKFYQGYFYIAGEFTSFNGTAVNRVCKIDLDGNVTALGDGFNNTVWRLAIGADGTLYACGAFTASGATSIDYTAYFDGSDWQELGGGTAGLTKDIKIDNNGDIYCAVWTTNPGVFILTGGSWVELGAMAFPTCIIFGADGSLYCGTDAAGNYLHKYNTGTSSWDNTLLSSCAEIIIINNNLYGASAPAVGTTNGYITKINLSTLNQTALFTVTGTANTGFRRVYNINDYLYFVGHFDTVIGHTITDGVLPIINDNFQAIDINFPGSADIWAVDKDNIGNTLFGYNTPGDATVAGDDTITNAGTAKTYPIIEVTGPGLLRQIVNTTTGKGIYFNNLTLLAGEVITMDLRPGRISMVSTFRGSVLGYVLPGSSYDFPLMPGSNRIATFIDGITDSNTTATMQWVENYHGIDGAQYA
jgi:hypothetical protein